MQQFVTRIAFRAKNDFFCFFDTTHRRVLRATGNAPDWLKLRVFGRHALRNPGAKTLQFLLLSSRTRHSVHVPGPGPRSTNSLCFLRPPFKGQSYLKPRLSSEQIYPQRKRQKLPSPSFLSFLLFSVVLFKFLF